MVGVAYYDLIITAPVKYAVYSRVINNLPIDQYRAAFNTLQPTSFPSSN